MSPLYRHNGKILVVNNKLAANEACCCDDCCAEVQWHRIYGACNGLPDDFVVASVDGTCYAYYTWEDWDCQNELVGRDCGAAGQCNIYARVKVTGDTPGPIEYLQSRDPDVWGQATPGGFCDCPDSFGSLSVQCGNPGECVEAAYVNGPSFTYEWDGFGWILVGISQEDANQACFDFADANGLSSGGASSPPFNGAFIGEQVTFSSCICGS